MFPRWIDRNRKDYRSRSSAKTRPAAQAHWTVGRLKAKNAETSAKTALLQIPAESRKPPAPFPHTRSFRTVLVVKGLLRRKDQAVDFNYISTYL
jgi:hypothetical protein